MLLKCNTPDHITSRFLLKCVESLYYLMNMVQMSNGLSLLSEHLETSIWFSFHEDQSWPHAEHVIIVTSTSKIIISYHNSETSHQIIFFCSLKAEHFPETHIKWIKSDPLKWYFKLTSIPLIFHPFTSREQLFALSRQVIFLQRKCL